MPLGEILEKNIINKINEMHLKGNSLNNVAFPENAELKKKVLYVKPQIKSQVSKHRK